jgi:hypothetical protein
VFGREAEEGEQGVGLVGDLGEVIPADVEAITAGGQIVPAEPINPPSEKPELAGGLARGGKLNGTTCFDIGATGHGRYTLTFTSGDGTKETTSVPARRPTEVLRPGSNREIIERFNVEVEGWI